MPRTLTRTARSSAARALRLPADLAHQRRTAAHRRQLAALSGLDADLLTDLHAAGCATTSIDALDLDSGPAMLAEAARRLEEMESAARLAGDDVRLLRAPQIFTVTDLTAFAAFGTEPRLTAIAEHYIGAPVVFQGVHLRWDFANPEPVTTELWHKDLEDRRMLKVIVYLNDVAIANGPFEYVARGDVPTRSALRVHLRTFRNQSMGVDDTQMAAIVPPARWRRCTGVAGSTVFMDPVAIFHHGRPRTADRAAAFFVYTAADPLRPELCEQYRNDAFFRPVEPRPPGRRPHR